MRTAESAPDTAAPAVSGRQLAFILTALTAMGAMSTDLYLPALPAIADDLATSAANAQLTIGLFFAGFAVMQLVCGPLADRYGRRPVLIGGLVIFLLTSAACALASTIEILLLARFGQAFGAACGPVIARAIVRDLYEPRDAGRVLGTIATAMALAPLVAPVLGGWLTVAFGWRSNFVLLTLIGVALIAVVIATVPETQRVRQPDALNPRIMAANFASLLRQPTFVGFSLCVGFASGSLFAWISSSSFVVIDYFGVPAQHFGLIFGIVILGFALGAFAGSRLTGRFGPARVVGVATHAALVAALVMLAAGWTGWGGLGLIVAAMAVCFAAAGVTIPQATAGALGPFPLIAGTASAALGCWQMVVAFLVNGASSLAFDGTPRPMVTIALLCTAGGLLAYHGLVRRRSS
ncbi:multidrug effflux MFS transporter [Marinivivus vitaminiproducens]|uniref:multidrug effflux MFS transporter n=1 Tax=Marinivivus vitaminiproducens TaxID=3035935 RepID=UPI0027A05A66|nr:multidrug effflux MFS transporter [Geminicoccaceae bacterium SCSIO 64248]